MNLFNALSDILIFVIKRKLYYAARIVLMLSRLLFKLSLFITTLLNKMNADSFIFAVIFFALGFFMYGDKFRPDPSTKRRPRETHSR